MSKIKVTKEELYPVYLKPFGGEQSDFVIEIDVNLRTWLDYKMALGKFMKAKHKLDKEIENGKTK